MIGSSGVEAGGWKLEGGKFTKPSTSNNKLQTNNDSAYTTYKQDTHC
jgi:hypothetical protein